MRINFGPAQKALEVLFVVLWLPFRLAIPGYCVYFLARNLTALWSTAPIAPLTLSFVMLPFLNYLNWVWFIKIIRIVTGAEKETSGKAE